MNCNSFCLMLTHVTHVIMLLIGSMVQFRILWLLLRWLADLIQELLQQHQRFWSDKIVNRSLVVQGLRWTVWAERTTWRPMGRPMGRWWIDESMYWSIQTDVIDVIKNLCITNWDMMTWWYDDSTWLYINSKQSRVKRIKRSQESQDPKDFFKVYYQRVVDQRAN